MSTPLKDWTDKAHEVGKKYKKPWSAIRRITTIASVIVSVLFLGVLVAIVIAYYSGGSQSTSAGAYSGGNTYQGQIARPVAPPAVNPNSPEAKIAAADQAAAVAPGLWAYKLDATASQNMIYNWVTNVWNRTCESGLNRDALAPTILANPTPSDPAYQAWAKCGSFQPVKIYGYMYTTWMGQDTSLERSYQWPYTTSSGSSGTANLHLVWQHNHWLIDTFSVS